MSHRKHIVWAIDAFAEKSLQIKGIKILKLVSEAFGLEVEPVYVLSSGQVQVQSELYPKWSLDYEKASENLLDDLIRLANLSKVSKPTVLIESTGSLRGATEELVKFSQNKHAKFIFVNSHANEGLPRFFLGSFTETLLLQSKIPVIVTNPTTEMRGKISHILFPTDFYNDARKGFEDAVQLAVKLQAKLTLYHKEITPLYLTFPEAPFYSIYIEDIHKQIKKNAADWLAWAKNQGAKCELVMDNSVENGVLGKHLIAYGEKNNVDLICLITKSSALGAALLGSTARYVTRHAHCPVWVEHA
uniref:UspA domain-containing protein n=1 Tax=uncultured bacterium Ak20-3 TaxID=798570 RepID=D9MX75_9BACT|nr:hypothetical protein AKSOIL_0344 [uncultured bacterium Ak20-3]